MSGKTHIQWTKAWIVGTFGGRAEDGMNMTIISVMRRKITSMYNHFALVVTT